MKPGRKHPCTSSLFPHLLGTCVKPYLSIFSSMSYHGHHYPFCNGNFQISVKLLYFWFKSHWLPDPLNFLNVHLDLWVQSSKIDCHQDHQPISYLLYIVLWLPFPIRNVTLWPSLSLFITWLSSTPTNLLLFVHRSFVSLPHQECHPCWRFQSVSGIGGGLGGLHYIIHVGKFRSFWFW